MSIMLTMTMSIILVLVPARDNCEHSRVVRGQRSVRRRSSHEPVHIVIVSLEVILTGKCFATISTLVRLLTRVGPGVLSKVFLGEELFATKVTFVFLALKMNSLLVINQGRVGLESGSTISTQVFLQLTVD